MGIVGDYDGTTGIVLRFSSLQHCSAVTDRPYFGAVSVEPMVVLFDCSIQLFVLFVSTLLEKGCSHKSFQQVSQQPQLDGTSPHDNLIPESGIPAEHGVGQSLILTLHYITGQLTK